MPRPKTADGGFSAEQIDLIKRTFLANASKQEVDLFIDQCERTQLDPLARQIYAVFRNQWDPEARQKVKKMTIQVSIDGLRLIAERSGRYEGQSGPEWCGKDGVWKDVWVESTPPVAARVGVWKQGARTVTNGVAHWSEYAQTTGEGKRIGLWATMPAGQLAKCAESLALRKAFPQETSGLYTTEEMAQADTDHESAPAPAAPPAPVESPPNPKPENPPLTTKEKVAKRVAKTLEKDATYGATCNLPSDGKPLTGTTNAGSQDRVEPTTHATNGKVVVGDSTPTEEFKAEIVPPKQRFYDNLDAIDPALRGDGKAVRTIIEATLEREVASAKELSEDDWKTLAQKSQEALIRKAQREGPGMSPPEDPENPDPFVNE